MTHSIYFRRIQSLRVTKETLYSEYSSRFLQGVCVFTTVVMYGIGETSHYPSYNRIIFVTVFFRQTETNWVVHGFRTLYDKMKKKKILYP